jgi:predicted RND superfamily exporter protein
VDLSAKLQDMKSLSWPLAAVAMTAMVVIGTLALLGRDVSTVSNVIIFLLMALGIAELREIKSNTNGTNNRMLDELAQNRRTQERILDKALDPVVSTMASIAATPPSPQEYVPEYPEPR